MILRCHGVREAGRSIALVVGAGGREGLSYGGDTTSGTAPHGKVDLGPGGGHESSEQGSPLTDYMYPPSAHAVLSFGV